MKTGDGNNERENIVSNNGKNMGESNKNVAEQPPASQYYYNNQQLQNNIFRPLQLDQQNVMYNNNYQPQNNHKPSWNFSHQSVRKPLLDNKDANKDERIHTANNNKAIATNNNENIVERFKPDSVKTNQKQESRHKKPKSEIHLHKVAPAHKHFSPKPKHEINNNNEQKKKIVISQNESTNLSTKDRLESTTVLVGFEKTGAKRETDEY